MSTLLWASMESFPALLQTPVNYLFPRGSFGPASKLNDTLHRGWASLVRTSPEKDQEMEYVEIESVFDPADAVIDIVLVHGGLYPKRMPWTHVSGSDSVFWPKTILGPAVGRARILAFNYNPRLESFWAAETDPRADLNELSDELLFQLGKKRSGKDTADRPIMIIAHSLGGLVAQNCLVRGMKEDKKVAQRVRRIAFLGTPFETEASKWATLANKFSLLLGQSLGSSSKWDRDELELRSARLACLSKDFDQLLQKRQGAKLLKVACFYEASSTVARGVKQPIHITDAANVKIPCCPKEPTRITATHQGMAEVAQEIDRHYRPLHRELESWVQELVAAAELVRATGDSYHATFGDNNNSFQIGHNVGSQISGISFAEKTRVGAQTSDISSERMERGLE